MVLEVPCYAKVNLFLAVGAKDSRGYHPIRTIFQAISLADTLTISDETNHDAFVCEEDLPERNTVTKAWAMLKEFARLPPLRVELSKSIPMESGLGGGSSDAAGLLRAINRVSPQKVAERDLFEIAQAVGADVPFFLLGGRAKGEGYGEKLTPLPDTPPMWLVLARPDVGCATAEMYAALDKEPFEWKAFPASQEAYNDFERVAPRQCLELIGAMKGLGTPVAGLSGSGSAVYGIFASQEQAKFVRRELQGRGVPWVQISRTLSRAESLDF